MFKFIRRVSTSFFPRPDRPWNGDATSNAPQVQIGKKRRYDADDDEPNRESVPPASVSSTPGTPGTPQHEAAYGSVMKKQKVEMDVDEPTQTAEDGTETAVPTQEVDAGSPTQEATQEAISDDLAPTATANEEESVKEVTEGVREVEISPQSHAQPEPEPEATPPEAAKGVESEPTAVPIAISAEAEATVPLPESPVLDSKTVPVVAHDEPIDIPESGAEGQETEAEVETVEEGITTAVQP